MNYDNEKPVSFMDCLKLSLWIVYFIRDHKTDTQFKILVTSTKKNYDSKQMITTPGFKT